MKNHTDVLIFHTPEICACALLVTNSIMRRCSIAAP
jgi:hypothetical protein